MKRNRVTADEAKLGAFLSDTELMKRKQVTADEARLVGKFLAGDLKEGSTENLVARRVLARVLRWGRLDLGLRWALAELFDGEMELFAKSGNRTAVMEYDEQPHMLVLKRRRGRGRPVRGATSERKIAEFIWQQRYLKGEPMAKVLDDVEK